MPAEVLEQCIEMCGNSRETINFTETSLSRPGRREVGKRALVRVLFMTVLKTVAVAITGLFFVRL